MITKGLLEKKRITLPLNRIQAIRIVENPLRQIFGFATVVVESAGGNGEKGGDKKIALFPLIKKQHCVQTLEQLFPEMNWHPEFIKAPKRARPFFYRIDFILARIPIIGASSYFLYPYGLLAFLLIPLIIFLGIWQHRTAGYMIDEAIDNAILGSLVALHCLWRKNVYNLWKVVKRISKSVNKSCR
ncbi:hypothetical protein LSPH24S_03042 [Lysinibacillus sphaericus]